jgi:hypothetical protein
LAPTSNGPAPKIGPTKSLARKTTAKAAGKSAKGGVAAKPLSSQTARAKAPQMSLREVLTQILKKMGAPLTGSELAEEVLKTGYKTSSKKFVNILYVMLGRMDNVEHVEGEGYRLKRKT